MDLELTLTRAQLAALRYVFAFRAAHAYAPSVRELTAGIGLRSTNGAACIVEVLIKKGLAAKAPIIARSIALTEAGAAVARGEVVCRVRDPEPLDEAAPDPRRSPAA